MGDADWNTLKTKIKNMIQGTKQSNITQKGVVEQELTKFGRPSHPSMLNDINQKVNTIFKKYGFNAKFIPTKDADRRRLVERLVHSSQSMIRDTQPKNVRE